MIRILANAPEELARDVIFIWNLYQPKPNMFLNWNEYRSGLLATIGKFAKLQPEFMKGFQQMDKSASENKHLDPMTHELIALAVAINLNTGAALTYTARALDVYDSLPNK